MNYNNIYKTKVEDEKENKENKENKEQLKDNQNEEDKPKKKFMPRPGDWYCKYCNNLNFSFRNSCNRCRLSKIYSY